MHLKNFIYFLLILVTIGINYSYGQVQKARLPRTINVPTKSHIYPSLSSDESYMVFYSNYSNTSNYELKYSKKIGRDLWQDPEYIQYILKPGNDHFGSFSISPDGQYLLFSSYRARGIGKYDILISKRSGDQWSQPINPGKPLNSPGNDGNACMSPDGRSIYFMRCTAMDETTKSGCKIFVSHKKSKTMWGEPEELPSYINTGHTTSPRILSDNETLIFSSEKPGNMGKLDLYMTRIENGTWSQPVPMDIINSVRNDEFVSIPARGDIVYYTDVYNDQFNIALALLPQELRPKKVVLIAGTIANRSSTDKINVQAYDAETGNLISGIPLAMDEDEFSMILPEGRIYDFSIFPLDGMHNYSSQLLDLKSMETSRRESLDFKIEKLRINETYSLDAITIDSLTNMVSAYSAIEIKRLMAIIQKNPSLSFEIQCFTNKPLEMKSIEDTIEVASAEFDHSEEPGIVEMVDANEGFIDLEEDDSTINEYQTTYSASDIDTSQHLLEKSYRTEMDEIVLFDPQIETQKRAEILVNKLIEDGTPGHRLNAVGFGYLPSSDESLNNRPYFFKLKVVL